VKDGHAELLTDWLVFYYFRMRALWAYQKNQLLNSIESTLFTCSKMGCHHLCLSYK